MKACALPVSIPPNKNVECLGICNCKTVRILDTGAATSSDAGWSGGQEMGKLVQPLLHPPLLPSAVAVHQNGPWRHPCPNSSLLRMVNPGSRKINVFRSLHS